MALEIEEIRSIDRLVRTSEEWKEVLSTCGEDRLFLSLAWLKPWWECFGDRRELQVLRVSEDGRAVGFAPFMVTSRGRIAHWRKLEFIGSGPSDRCGIIAAEGRPDVHRAIWDHLRAKDDWDVIELRDIQTGGPTEQNVRACHPSAEYVTSISPHIILKNDYPTYFAGLSRSMRSNLGRGWRRLEDEGAVLRALRTPAEMEEATRYLKELSDARWDIANVLKTPRMVEFVTRAALEMAAEGSVAFHAIEVNGHPTAISMGFEDQDRYLHYLSGFDPELAKYSPGSVLLLKIIEDCYRAGRTEVDLLRGIEPYKYRFNAVDRIQVHFRALNRGVLRSASCALREAPLS
jgi:CelD/BcsL family acetyltransferase involved in cellulose biosynthesis